MGSGRRAAAAPTAVGRRLSVGRVCAPDLPPDPQAGRAARRPLHSTADKAAAHLLF